MRIFGTDGIQQSSIKEAIENFFHHNSSDDETR
jgi:hypothetical protein